MRPLCKRYLAAGNALDRSVKVNIEGDGTPFILVAPGVKNWQQIIGVVADVRNNGLDKPVKPAIYLPFSAFMLRYVEILVKGRIDPQMLIQGVRQQIATVDPDQQIYGRTDNIETSIHDQPEWGRARLVSILFAIFAALALALSAIGLYSVVSFSVAQRTPEFGIRIALGAQKSDVLRIVMGVGQRWRVGGDRSGSLAEPGAYAGPAGHDGRQQQQSGDCSLRYFFAFSHRLARLHGAVPPGLIG